MCDRYCQLVLDITNMQFLRAHCPKLNYEKHKSFIAPVHVALKVTVLLTYLTLNTQSTIHDNVPVQQICPTSQWLLEASV